MEDCVAFADSGKFAVDEGVGHNLSKLSERWFRGRATLGGKKRS